MELGWGRNGGFGKKEGNGDYARQREVVDRIRGSDAWERSGGRDHLFVLTDPIAMWHVRAEIAPAILRVVDFGGWYKLDAKASDGNSSHMIKHTQVSLLKDVIVPYMHLLPRLNLMEDRQCDTLLYFRGAKHRHRGGRVREKSWDLLLVNELDVIIEEGFPNATVCEQSITGMRTSEFCLHPAGDTPTSSRLFDAIVSLCIPVIISDSIQLPFEGMIDYLSSQFLFQSTMRCNRSGSQFCAATDLVLSFCFSQQCAATDLAGESFEEHIQGAEELVPKECGSGSVGFRVREWQPWWSRASSSQWCCELHLEKDLTKGPHDQGSHRS